MRKTTIWAGVFLSVAAVLVFVLWIISERSISSIEQQGTGLHEYKRYYMMISDDHSRQWETIFQTAQDEAEQTDATVEWVGQDMSAAYSGADCMKIAAAAKPDGIILYQNQGDDLTELIDEAYERDIPVITILNDAGASKRISFIGINSYQMGEIYGEQILQTLDGASGEILVLFPENRNGESDGLLYTQMLRRVEEGKKEEQDVSFSSYEISTLNSFDAEEDIRDIFVSKELLPSVLICLDPVSTECAYQALVDYNEVGNLSIIGYYASENTIQAVEKGLIASTLSVDAEEIGRLAITAMNEYCESGHVSSYFNVGIEMISQENIARYQKARQEESEADGSGGADGGDQ